MHLMVTAFSFSPPLLLLLLRCRKRQDIPSLTEVKRTRRSDESASHSRLNDEAYFATFISRKLVLFLSCCVLGAPSRSDKSRSLEQLISSLPRFLPNTPLPGVIGHEGAGKACGTTSGTCMGTSPFSVARGNSFACPRCARGMCRSRSPREGHGRMSA